MNPLYNIDFYKVGHVSQYPQDTTRVWSNWTPRSARVPAEDGVRFFGLQYHIKKDLRQQWYDGFFSRPWFYVVKEYKEIIKATLGVENPRTDHIEKLHGLGYLPIDIYALPEGTSSPLKVPQLVITNTTDDSFWLPNYIETALSNTLWKPCTSATTAKRYRNIFEKYARLAGETDLSFVDYMGHDFSYRGMSGTEDAVLSGMGHLLSFNGTDTIPAILAADNYYNAGLGCGGSVPATEHSVMCAGEKDGEFETFKRLLTEVYPEGIVSVVSDTWDLWKVLTDYIPRLKEIILSRNGKLVIRPDSGDPVKILTGDDSKSINSPEWNGAMELLARALGVTSNAAGYELINNGGLIYGDSITPERAEEIMRRTIVHRFHPYNVVLGIGSFTYQFVTRDTYGFAMKATAVKRNGQVIPIFKKPITDSGEKTSLKGIPAVHLVNGQYQVVDEQPPEALDNCAFRKVFSNGDLLIEEDFDTIRKRVRN
jgi:nicotinamide phosphoribosyltransferase